MGYLSYFFSFKLISSDKRLEPSSGHSNHHVVSEPLSSLPFDDNPPSSQPSSLSCPDQFLFETLSTSHSPSNQKYLESKKVSKQPKLVYKQSSLDQTIASVQKAKASLNNLKEYVRKRKMEQLRKEGCGTVPRVRGKTEETSTTLKQSRDDASGGSISSGMIAGGQFHANQPESPPALTMTKADPSPPSSSRLLPETEIGDLLGILVSDYQNVNPPDIPPPVPPKPPGLMASKIGGLATSQLLSGLMTSPHVSESISSTSSSDLSSFDAMSGHSFTLWPEVNQCEVKDHLSATLDKFAGESGYMELKGPEQSDLCIDSTYDSVCKLMEAIRLGKKVEAEQQREGCRFALVEEAAFQPKTGPSRPHPPINAQSNDPTYHVTAFNPTSRDSCLIDISHSDVTNAKFLASKTSQSFSSNNNNNKVLFLFTLCHFLVYIY